MNITIVGGCFPVQHNIPEDRLYHHTLKLRLRDKGIETSFSLVRYERLSNCLPKIEAAAKDRHIDLLVFHLRAEPIMRISKLYYEYMDDAGAVRRSLNLPFLHMLNPEIHEVVVTRKIVPGLPSQNGETRLHHALREVNYLSGELIGNSRYALKRYLSLVLSVADFCSRVGGKLLVVGPVSRPFSRFENRLSEKIDGVFSGEMGRAGLPYLRTLGRYDNKGRDLFLKRSTCKRGRTRQDGGAALG